MARTYKVRDNETGEILEIPEAELKDYGLDPTAYQTKTSSTGSSTTSSKPTESKYITGRSLEEHAAALNAAKAAGDTAAIKLITDDYDREMQYQKEFGKKDATVELKGAAANDVNLWKEVMAASQEAQKKYKPGYSGLLDSILGKGRIAFNVADKDEVSYKQEIGNVRTAIRQYISGAAIPKAEAKEFLDLIPKVSDSDLQTQEKLEGLQRRAMRTIENTLQTAGYDITAEEYLNNNVSSIDPKRLQPENQTGNPLTDTIGNNRILNMILGTGSKIAQDVGTGVRNMQSQGNFNQLETQAKAFEDEAYATNDMQKRKDLLQNAQNLRSQISGEAGNISQSFSQEVNDPIALRAILGAAEVAGAAEIPGVTGFVKNLFKGGARKATQKAAEVGAKEAVQNAPSTLQQVIRPFKSAGEIRDQAAKQATEAGVQIDGNKMLKFLKEASNKISPTDKKTFDTYYDRAETLYKDKKITPIDSVDLLESANTAFTSAGNVGKSAKAAFNKKLGDFLRKEYKDDEAMQTIAAMNKRFSRLYPAKSFAVGAGKTAATGASTALLLKLLMGNNEDY